MVALAMATVTPSPPAWAATTQGTPTDSSDATARAQRAKSSYARGDFQGAARIYEDLWASTKTPKYLYNAGLAREAAGHRGQAIRHWRRFLAIPAAGEASDRAELQTRADLVASETPLLEVTLEPPSALAPNTSITLQPSAELTAAGLAPIDLADPISGDVDVKAASFKTSLDPGLWTLSITGLRGAEDQSVAIQIPPGASRTIRPLALAGRHVNFSVRTSPPLLLHPGADLVVRQDGAPIHRVHLRGRPVAITVPEGPVELEVHADGYHPAELPLDLRLEQPSTPVNLRLKLDARSHLRTRLGLGLGFGLPGLGLLVTGSILADAHYDAIEFADPARVPRSTRLRNHMAFLAGAGGGLMLGAAMGSIRPRSLRWWIAGSSFGGALTLAGGATALGLGSRYKWDELDRAVVRKQSNGMSAANTVLGMGAGLLTSSLAGFLTNLIQSRRTRKSLPPTRSAQ